MLGSAIGLDSPRSASDVGRLVLPHFPRLASVFSCAFLCLGSESASALARFGPSPWPFCASARL
eukprot:gene2594-30987_t